MEYVKPLKLDSSKQGIWFTSDTHFGHNNILKFCKRPWNTVEEMDEALINNWNAVVGTNDIVFHLGDFLHLLLIVDGKK
jgi:calcineurin-like phosphoesterase family protein